MVEAHPTVLAFRNIAARRRTDKGKPGVSRGRKATGLGYLSQPGCRR